VGHARQVVERAVQRLHLRVAPAGGTRWHRLRRPDQHLRRGGGGVALVQVGLVARTGAVHAVQVERGCAEVDQVVHVHRVLPQAGGIEGHVVVDKLTEVGEAGRNDAVLAVGHVHGLAQFAQDGFVLHRVAGGPGHSGKFGEEQAEAARFLQVAARGVGVVGAVPVAAGVVFLIHRDTPERRGHGPLRHG
jgi:hypothetical protein